MGKTLRRYDKPGIIRPRVFLLDCGHFVTYRIPYPANGSTVTCLQCPENDNQAVVRGKMIKNYREIIGEEIGPRELREDAKRKRQTG